jgi:proteasome lid subunit RPN8/RPN11
MLISSRALDEIERAARFAAHKECMGILASPPDTRAITDAYLLHADASCSHAEADPVSMKEAASQLAENNLVPRGMWHSHGSHDVYHSRTDLATIERLLPAMADSNLEPNVDDFIGPILQGPDVAAVKLADGRMLTIQLIGHQAGVFLDPTPMWRDIAFRRTDRDAPPIAIYDRKVALCGKGVVLELTVPEGCTVTSALKEPGSRVARLYSLVVNNRGSHEARCLLLVEVNGLVFTRIEPCELITREEGPARNGRLLTCPRSWKRAR